jgi:surface polysaccharide O-acyltransferase-like enzyme
MAGFVHRFHMPLLFAISGASTYLALRVRGPGKYLLERVQRLLIPALFTIVVLLPPMTYITRLARHQGGSFIKHFIGFFEVNPNDLAGVYGSWTPAHTWFILFLMIFSLIALPMFMLERRSKDHRVTAAIASFLEKPIALLLLFIPLALAVSLDLLGDKNPLYYFLVFCIGYLLMTDPRYQDSIDRIAPAALVLGIAFEVVRQAWQPSLQEWSLPWVGYGLMEQANRWLLVLAILGFGHILIRSGGPVLRYLSDAAFPFYILHLPINTLVGYYVIQLDTVLAVKYLLIVFLTGLLTFGVYEVVRRSAVTPFLFGIKVHAMTSAKTSSRPASAVQSPLIQ